MSQEQKNLIAEAKKLCDKMSENESMFTGIDESYIQKQNKPLERRLESVITELYETFQYQS